MPPHEGRTHQRRRSLRTKLLTGFVLVLLPVLLLVVGSFLFNQARSTDAVLDEQLLSAELVAVAATDMIDTALALGESVAANPLVRTMDPAILDPRLRELLQSDTFDSINVFDATGANRGWGHRTEPAEPRLRIGDRPYFREAMESGEPSISPVILLRRPTSLGYLVSVPIRGAGGAPIGVVNVVTRTDLLAARYERMLRISGQSILLADPTGRLAFTTSAPQLDWDQSAAYQGFQPLRRALEGEPVAVRGFASPLFGDERIGAFVPTPRYGWAVGVTMPRDLALAPVRRTLTIELAIFAALLVASAGLAAWIARRLAGPVRRLQLQAAAIGAGELSRRVEIRTGDELEELGDSFNEMAVRLEERDRENARLYGELARALRLREEFMAAAAHELNTPVTTVRTWAELLSRTPGRPDQEQRALRSILRQTDRLRLLVNDLLVAIRLRGAREEVRHEAVDLAATIRAAADAAAGVRPLDVSLEEPLVVRGDPELLRTLVAHLLADAIRSSPPDATVDVIGRAAEGQVRISVHDRGPGIPPERQPFVFEPFYGPAPPGAAGYLGVVSLGLYVGREIVEAHGGSIEIESRPGEGKTVRFRIPSL